MNILMVSPFLPFPPNSGGKARVYNILRHLRKHHRVTFVVPSFGKKTSPLHEDDHVINLPPISKWRTIRSLFSLAPYHVALVGDDRIKTYIRNLLERRNYHLIYLHYIYSLQYIPDGIGVPTVLDPQNVDRDIWFTKFQNRANPLHLRIYALLNAYRTIYFEMHRLKTLYAYISVSEKDCLKIKKYAGAYVQNHFVAPNGVDTDMFSQKPVRAGHEQKMVLGFLGSMSLWTNQQAARELCLNILPLVRQHLPGWEISVLIVGKDPPNNILEIGKINQNIRITGTVSNPVEYLHQMDIMVLPLREGAGTKLRVLEGMSVGLPVVGTRFAFQGIDGLKSNQNCCYADTKEELSQAIVDLARDPKRRESIGAQARKLVVERYEWEKIVKSLSRELTFALGRLSPISKTTDSDHAHPFL